MNATFHAVWAISVALLHGLVLQVHDVSAGNGMVVDWRTVKSGETLQGGADAFDTARLFIALVGPEAALATLDDEAPEPPPLPSELVRVHAYMVQPNGGRLRSFEAGPFKVLIEAHEDDEAQASFAQKLAEAAVALVVVGCAS